MPGTVAKRYAAALFELALDKGRVEEIDNQAALLEELFRDATVREFLANPHIADERKKQVVERQLKEIVDGDLLNLVRLLIDKRRTEFIVEIMSEYDNLTNVHRGVEDVRIVSAVPLSKDQRQRIVDEVRRFTTYGDLRVETEVDTGVLGGAKVFLGANVVIDGTVSSQLNEMRSQLMRYEHRGVSA